MKALLLAVALLLCASAAFAVMAYLSPVKSFSQLTFPMCGNNPNWVPYCVSFEMANFPQQSPLYNTLWSYQAHVEIAEGFAVLVLLISLMSVKRLDCAWLHRPLAPRFPKPLVIILALTGASFFVTCALVGANYYNFVHTQNWGIYSSLLYPLSLGNNGALGVPAFCAWCLTVLVISLRTGLVGAVKEFGVPALLFLMSALVVFDSGEMILYVTQFTKWSVGGVPLISNWCALIVSAGLFGWTLLRDRLN